MADDQDYRGAYSDPGPRTGAYAGWGSEGDVVTTDGPEAGGDDPAARMPEEWRQAASEAGFLPASGADDDEPAPGPGDALAPAPTASRADDAPGGQEPDGRGGKTEPRDGHWLPHSRHVNRDGIPAERLRVAYRAFLGLWAGFALGALCAFWPTWPFTVDALLDYGVLAFLSDEHAAMLTMAVFGLGGIAMAYSLTVIGYRRLASRFYLMPQAISEERGLIARRVSRVELAHIRTVDVRQSVLDRVLGIGSIHFASAGTGADDVTWDSVLDPVATQRAVLQRLRQTEDD